MNFTAQILPNRGQAPQVEEPRKEVLQGPRQEVEVHHHPWHRPDTPCRPTRRKEGRLPETVGHWTPSCYWFVCY